MSSKSLWGSIGDEPVFRTPTAILKEQAAALAQQTDDLLRGKVVVVAKADTFLLDLSIVAPLLDNYKFDVLHVEHGVEQYPASIVPAWLRYQAGEVRKCANEESFTAALESILSSERVRKIVHALIAQSDAV